MRKLMWFSIGFTASALICAYLFCNIFSVVIALLGGLCGLALLFCKNKLCSIVSVAVIGFSFGMLYCWGFDSLVLNNAEGFDGKNQYISFEATDYSFDTDYGICADGKVSLGGKNYKVRLYLHDDVSLNPGDLVTGFAEFRYTVGGELQPSTYHKGEGIYLLAYAQESMTVSEGDSSKYFVSNFRHNIVQRVEDLFAEDTTFFAKALLLGNDSDISYSDEVALQKSGIRHVVAVSGMHVSLLFSILYLIFGRRKLLLALFGIPVLFLFAAVAGFTPSVVRACVMQAMVILAYIFDKENDPATALSFSVLVMILLNPLVVTAVGFQLSVGCMIGIYAFSGHIRDRFYSFRLFKGNQHKSLTGKLKRWIVGSVSISVSTMVVTMPLCALYFGEISLIGILNNLLSLWIISIIFCGIIVSLVLSLLWLPLGAFAASIIAWPIRLVLLIARTLAKIPFVTASTDVPYVLIWIVLCYLLLIIYALSKRKRPVWLAISIAGLYMIAALATYIEPRLDNVRMSVLDVGQGQCVLLQNKDKTYMIDCGGEDPEQTADVARRALASQGIYRLDGLIITHFDKDHCNGASRLLQVVETDALYLPDADADSNIRKELCRLDIPIRWVEEPLKLRGENGVLQIIPAEVGASGNESSMCILFQSENCDILITGDRDFDGETLLMQQISLPDVDVIVAGHHGAGTSTGAELLANTHPEIVVISVGQNNRHGHPDPNTVSRLERFGCKIYRTDLEGTIHIRG